MNKRNLLMLISASFATASYAIDKVGMTLYNGEDMFVSSVRNHLEKAIQLQDGVKLIVADSKNNQSRQNDQVNALISSGVKALIINLVNIDSAQAITDKAKAADIPIIFFNKDPGRQIIRSYKKSYYIGSDPVQSAIIQGDLIAKGWQKNPSWDKNHDGVLQFVLLKGEPDHPDTQARSEWVVKELAQKSVPYQQLAEAYGYWNKEKGKQIMQTWLSSPQAATIEMVIANNDSMAIGAQEAAAEAGINLPIYGIDAVAEALQMVKTGQLAGTVLNNAEGQAMAIAQILPNLIMGYAPDEYTGYVFYDNYLRIPYVAIDKSNLDQFLK